MHNLHTTLHFNFSTDEIVYRTWNQSSNAGFCQQILRPSVANILLYHVQFLPPLLHALDVQNILLSLTEGNAERIPAISACIQPHPTT
jgi:hypothetical protein